MYITKLLESIEYVRIIQVLNSCLLPDLNSMIEKCVNKGLRFKTRDLLSTPNQYIFVLKRIVEVVPSNPFFSINNHVVQELEVLFAFTKAENELSRSDLYRIIDDTYRN